MQKGRAVRGDFLEEVRPEFSLRDRIQAGSTGRRRKAKKDREAEWGHQVTS